MTRFFQINWLLILLFFISCNKSTTNNQLTLNIDALIQQSDSINVYYTNNKEINFTDKQSFWIKVLGSKKNQKINIVFPDSLRPTQLRLDFGRNIKQKDIVLNKISINFKQKCFVAKGKEIFYIFRIDQNNTTFDNLNGSLNRKVADQINGPSLYPKGDKLYDVLNTLYKKP